MSEKKKVVLTPEEDRANSKAVLAHVLPFAIWLTMMIWFGDLYAARTIGGLVLLAIFRPWRWYPPLKLKNIPVALGVGVLIFVVWVGLESPWVVEKSPKVTEWYDRLFVDITHPLKVRETYEIPLSLETIEVREAVAIGDETVSRTAWPYEVIQEEGEFVGLHIYDPKVTGWFAFWMHMFGTSVVIAIIEEFFFRGFIYRWMLGTPFYKMDPGKLSWPILLMVSCFFGLEHFEWMAGIVCGIVFGLLYIKTQDIWAAIIAHGTTNFLLGLYIVKYGAYQFW